MCVDVVVLCIHCIYYFCSDVYMVFFRVDFYLVLLKPSWLVPAGLEISLSKAWKLKDLVWFVVCRLLSRVHPCPGASAG